MKDISRREFIRDWLLPTTAGTALVLSGTAIIAANLIRQEGISNETYLENVFDGFVAAHRGREVNINLLATQASGFIKKFSSHQLPPYLNQVDVVSLQAGRTVQTQHIPQGLIKIIYSNDGTEITDDMSLEEAAQKTKARFVDSTNTPRTTTSCDLRVDFTPITISRDALSHTRISPDSLPEEVVVTRTKYLAFGRETRSNGRRSSRRVMGETITVYDRIVYQGEITDPTLLKYEWHEYAEDEFPGVWPVDYYETVYGSTRSNISQKEFGGISDTISHIYHQIK